MVNSCFENVRRKMRMPENRLMYKYLIQISSDFTTWVQKIRNQVALFMKKRLKEV